MNIKMKSSPPPQIYRASLKPGTVFRYITGAENTPAGSRCKDRMVFIAINEVLMKDVNVQNWITYETFNNEAVEILGEMEVTQ